MTETVETIVAPEADTATDRRRKKASVNQDDAARVAKRVKILIPKTQQDKSDVYVSLNEYDCLIKRGVVVEVPDFVVEVLEQAVEERADIDGVVSRVPSYPFQIVG